MCPTSRSSASSISWRTSRVSQAPTWDDGESRESLVGSGISPLSLSPSHLPIYWGPDSVSFCPHSRHPHAMSLHFSHSFQPTLSPLLFHPEPWLPPYSVLYKVYSVPKNPGPSLSEDPTSGLLHLAPPKGYNLPVVCCLPSYFSL